jgi:DNA-binding response OmpR family regulator
MSQLTEQRCDLLILELKSKELDGVAFLEDFHERYHGEIPVFAVSKPFERDRDIAIDAGASAFLNKPLQMRTLFNTIAVCLGLEGS